MLNKLKHYVFFFSHFSCLKEEAKQITLMWLFRVAVNDSIIDEQVSLVLYLITELGKRKQQDEQVEGGKFIPFTPCRLV